MAAISGSTWVRRRWSSTPSSCSSSTFLSGAVLGAGLAFSCGAPGSPEHSRSPAGPPARAGWLPAPRTTSSPRDDLQPSPDGCKRSLWLSLPLWQGSTVPSHGQPARAQGSPLPRGLAAPARYLGADEDLPEQGLDVVVGSSHNDRDLVSGKDIFNVPQSGSTSRGARCGGLQAAPAGPDPLW